MTENKNRVCCLYRVSTDKQVDFNSNHEADLPMQRKACHKFAEAKVPELAEHYIRDYGACPLPSFGGAPRYELSGEAAMNIFVTYLK